MSSKDLLKTDKQDKELENKNEQKVEEIKSNNGSEEDIYCSISDLKDADSFQDENDNPAV